MRIRFFEKDGKKYMTDQKGTVGFTILRDGKFQTVTFAEGEEDYTIDFNSWDDIKANREYLEAFGLRFIMAQERLKSRTYVKMFVFLLNQPVYAMLLHRRKERNDQPCEPVLYEMRVKQDYFDACNMFKIEATDFWKNIWD